MMHHRILSFRQQPCGGDVRIAPSIQPSHALSSDPRLVLLIHGFNNDFYVARESYCAFLEEQARLGPLTGASIVEVYWPGDTGIRYWLSIDRARRTADALAQQLRRAAENRSRQRGKLEVYVVAHSMGCRLTLELLRNLHFTPHASLRVKRVVFFAAAVPIIQLRLGAAPLRVFEEDGVEALSLYSPEDFVLSDLFPKGQRMADFYNLDESGPPYVALGSAPLRAQPPLARLRQFLAVKAGHSDYWCNRYRDVASRARNFIALSVPDRTPDERAPATRLSLARKTATFVSRKLRPRVGC